MARKVLVDTKDLEFLFDVAEASTKLSHMDKSLEYSKMSLDSRGVPVKNLRKMKKLQQEVKGLGVGLEDLKECRQFYLGRNVPRRRKK